MITKYPIQIPYVVSDFEHHKDIKPKLLKFLEKQNSTKSKQICEIYERSDWYVDAGIMRDYWKFLYPSLSKHMAKIYKSLKIEKYSYSNAWFIQYGKDGKLDWHRYQDQYWASIYYVDLPKKSSKTLLKNSFDESIIETDVKEGQILTFPGIIEHCSPPSKDDKIIIAFNIKLKD